MLNNRKRSAVMLVVLYGFFIRVLLFCDAGQAYEGDQGSSSCCKISSQDAPDAGNPYAVQLKSGEMRSLIVKAMPVTPPTMLGRNHLSGKVIVAVCIDRDGNVISVQAIKGNPIAISSVVDSVRQWVFTPYKKNGKPVCATGQFIVKYDFRTKASQ